MDNEVVTLEIDIKQAEMAIGTIQDDFEKLYTIINGLGLLVAKMFAPLQKTFMGIGCSIDVLSANISVLTNMIQMYFDTISASGNDALLGLDAISAVISGISLGVDVIANWQKLAPIITSAISAITGGMVNLSLGAGGVGAIIAGIAIAILFLVKNWDEVKAALIGAWEAIKAAIGTAAEWLNTNVIQPVMDIFAPVVDWFSALFANIGQSGSEGFLDMGAIINQFCEVAKTAWDLVLQNIEEFRSFLQNIFAKDWTETFGAFGHVLNSFFANVENIWNAVKSIFDGIVGFVKNVFAGNWEGAWESIKQIISGVWDGIMAAVKTPINSIIGFINGLVSGVVSGVNTIIRALNGLSFTVPDWVPVLGGSSFGFNIRTLTAPQIPYLAKGAVLPANRPFLAMGSEWQRSIKSRISETRRFYRVLQQERVTIKKAALCFGGSTRIESCFFVLAGYW